MPAKTKLEIRLEAAKKKLEKQKLKAALKILKLKESSNKKVTALKEKSKIKSIGQLNEELDKAFSLYIRTRDSVDGYCTCATCGQVLPIKEIQCGHWIPRDKKNTRWDERNCAPQCYIPCNHKFSGNGKPHVMAIHLLDRWGSEAIHEIVELSKQSYKASKMDLQDKIAYFKEKLAALSR